MVTIYDIAKEAGVSISTVSNVIHGVKSHVSPDTVERIKKIIEEKQYKPNMSARALATKNSRIVGMLSHVEKQDYTCLPEDPFLGMLFRSVEMELSARNYYLMIKTVSTEEELLDLHKNWNFAGMIIHGVFEGSFFNQLSKMSLPCVLIDSYIKHNRFLNIGLEDFKGAYAATSYLIKKGHKNIAFASPDIFETGVVAERFAGYKAALSEAGIEFNQNNVFQVSTLDSGWQIGEKLSARPDITGIFATADFLAMGIISALQSHNIRVPDDKSVIGFDDIFASQMFNPPVTTIRQDVTQKGRLAVQALVDLIEGRECKVNTVLPVNLVERKSVKQIEMK